MVQYMGTFHCHTFSYFPINLVSSELNGFDVCGCNKVAK